MAALKLIEVPAAGDVAEVRDGVSLLAAAQARGDGPWALIRDGADADDAQAAPRGPVGFTLDLHRVAPSEPFNAASPDDRVTAIIVVRGGIKAFDGTGLGPRSLQLLGPGQRARFLGGHAESEVLLLTYVPPTRRPLASGPRVARAAELYPLRSRAPFSWVPDDIGDFLSPRDLYLALGPSSAGPLGFRVAGPEKLVVVFVQTPRGTGPALHVHTQTTEMFCALEGRFKITWGDHGEHEQILERFDSIVIPPGHNRAFEALDEGENWILPMVVGANDETEDILWLEHIFEPVRQKLPRLSALASRVKLQVGRRV